MDIGFQSTLSATTMDSSDTVVYPHAPITCHSKLRYNEDNSFECEHAKVGANDPRTNRAVRHSIAVLLIELAVENY